MGETGGFIAVVLFFIFIFEGFNTSAKYQVGNCGPNSAIVLDTKTGEAWMVKDSTNGLRYLRPLHYEYKQMGDPNTRYYTKPEETRSDQNVTWWTLFKRKLQNGQSNTKMVP